MTILIFLAACFFTLVMGAMMVLPFFQVRDEQIKFEVLDEDLKEIEALTQKKAIHVQQLMEIDDDLLSEKLTAADHAQLKKRYEREIILIMRRLDEIHGGKGWQERVQRLRPSQQAEERDVEVTQPPSTTIMTAEESAPPLDTPPQGDGEMDDSTPPPAAAAATTSTLVCETCLKSLSAEDRFCAQCGTPVTSAASLTTTSKEEQLHTEEEVTTP